MADFDKMNENTVRQNERIQHLEDEPKIDALKSDLICQCEPLDGKNNQVCLFLNIFNM